MLSLATTELGDGVIKSDNTPVALFYDRVIARVVLRELNRTDYDTLDRGLFSLVNSTPVICIRKEGQSNIVALVYDTVYGEEIVGVLNKLYNK